VSDGPAEITVQQLPEFVGRQWTSGWIEMTQDRITRFAEVTEDRQWIHVDADRAATDSPYGSTIAHGFLTLSLISHLMRDSVRIVGGRMNINYGLNKVRFPSAVPSGARVRGRFTLQQVEPAGDALQATWAGVIEREGSDKPCCVAEWLVRTYA
jgi:acyl dehydratase